MSSGLMTRLLEEGNYDHILIRIFHFLDGVSIEACSLVCKRWNLFLNKIYFTTTTLKSLDRSWRIGVSTSRRLDIRSRVQSMYCDKETILLGLEDGQLEIWNRNSYKFRKDSGFGTISAHNQTVSSVDMNGSYIVSGGWDGSIRVWNRSDGTCLASTDHPSSVPITGLYLESDSRIYIASRDGTVRIMKRFKSTIQFDPNYALLHEDCIIDMCVDGSRLLTGCGDAKLVLWNKDDGSVSRILKGHTNGIRKVYMRRDYAISGSRDRTARLWKLSTGETLRTFKHSIDVRSVVFNRNIVITGDDYSDLYVWDMNRCIDTNDTSTPKQVSDVSSSSSSYKNDLLLRSLTGHNGMVHSLYVTPTCLLSCDVTGLLIERDFASCVREGPSLKILRCTDGVNCMVCDRDYVICGLLNRTLAVFDRNTFEKIRVLNGHSDHIWSVAMNDCFLVSGSWDSSVKVWNKSEWSPFSSFHHPHDREISGVCFVKNKIFASCLSGSVVVLVLDESGTEFILEKLVSCRQDLGEIYSLATDGKYLLTGHTLTSTSLQLWSLDLEPLSVVRENVSESIVWNLFLSYPLALVCRDNETLDVYHLESKTCLKSLRHESKVLNATLYGDTIIVGCQYGLLVFWSLSTVLKSDNPVLDHERESIKTLSEHSGAIANVYIDDNDLITDDYDGVVISRKLALHSDLRPIFVNDREILK